MALRRRTLLDVPHLETASGSLIVLNKAIAAPMKNCVITFLPMQSGSGTPSPSNVRPIIGRSAIPITVSRTQSGAADQHSLGRTVYGGYVDLSTGILVATYKMFKLASDTYIYGNASGNFMSINNVGMLRFTIRPENMGFCDKIELLEGSRPGTRFLTMFGTYEGGSFYDNIYIYDIDKYDSSVTNLDTARAALRAIDPTWVFRLSTPMTYQLSPQIIRTLRGVNNIWSDAGDITIKYWTH